MKKVKKYIKDNTRTCSNEYSLGMYVSSCAPWLTPEDALTAAEIAKEDTIKKVCKWLEVNANKYDERIQTIAGTIRIVNVEKLTKDLKKAFK